MRCKIHPYMVYIHPYWLGRVELSRDGAHVNGQKRSYLQDGEIGCENEDEPYRRRVLHPHKDEAQDSDILLFPMANSLRGRTAGNARANRSLARWP